MLIWFRLIYKKNWNWKETECEHLQKGILIEISSCTFWLGILFKWLKRKTNNYNNQMCLHFSLQNDRCVWFELNYAWLIKQFILFGNYSMLWILKQ